MSNIADSPITEPPAAELTEDQLPDLDARTEAEQPDTGPERGLTGTIILDERTIHVACTEHIEAIWNVDVELVEIRRRKGKGLEVVATVTPMRENR